MIIGGKVKNNRTNPGKRGDKIIYLHKEKVYDIHTTTHENWL